MTWGKPTTQLGAGLGCFSKFSIVAIDVEMHCDFSHAFLVWLCNLLRYCQLLSLIIYIYHLYHIYFGWENFQAPTYQEDWVQVGMDLTCQNRANFVYIPPTCNIRPIIFPRKKQCFPETSNVPWVIPSRLTWPHSSTVLSQGSWYTFIVSESSAFQKQPILCKCHCDEIPKHHLLLILNMQLPFILHSGL